MKKISEGNFALAVEWPKSFGKDKERLRTLLGLLRIYAHHKMCACARDAAAHAMDAQKSQAASSWSVCLQNLLSAETLIFERNLSAAYVLQHLFSELCESLGNSSFPGIGNNASLLSEIAV